LRFKFDYERFRELPKSLSVQPEAVCGCGGANSYTDVKTLHHAVLGDATKMFPNRIIPATDFNVQPTSRLFPTLWISHEPTLAARGFYVKLKHTL
jgi:hypothetical protein